MLQKSARQFLFSALLKHFFTIGVFLAFAFFLFLSSLLQAHAASGINKQVNFQGKLVDNTGLTVADNTYTVVFTLYSAASAGTTLWTETDSVTTSGGIFQVSLGAVSTLNNVDFNSSNMYLGIKVGADAEMSPRIQFAAVPYAFNANALDDVVATQSASGFTLTGGYQTQKTLTLNDNISLGTTIQPTLANTLQVQSTGANALTLDTGGGAALNVGLLNATSLVFGNATSNPSFAFNGTGAFTVNGGGNNNITLGGATGTGNIVIQPNAGGQAALIIKDQGLGDIFTASAGATTQFVIKNNGFVGIGTNAPGTNALQVNGGPVYVNGNAFTADGTVRSNNLFWLSNGNTGTSPVLRLEDYNTAATGVAESAKLAGTDTVETEWQALQIIKEQTWTGVASTRNSAFVISNLLNNATVESARFTSGGTLAIGTQTPLTSSGLDIEKDTLGNATLVINQKSSGPGQGDILTASSSGTTRFNISDNGTLKMFGSTSGYTGFIAPATAPSVIYTLPTSAPTAGYVLSSTNTTGTLSWIAAGGGGGCATCLQQVPANTAANTVTVGATASTVGLTINNSTNATTADALDINMVQASGTATNGLSITESTGTGVTTNGIQITQSGTAAITNALTLTGAFTKLINATNFNVSNAGTVTIASGQSYTGAGAVTVDSASATALTLGNTNANAITLGNTANTATIGINTSASTGTGVTLTANGVTTGTGLFITSTGNVQGTGVLTQITDNSATTGKVLAVNGTGLTTGYGIYVTGGTQVTQGGDLYLNGAIYNHTIAETGSLATVSFNDQSSDATGADTTTSNGLNVLTQFTTTGAASKNINGINIAAPSTQSCTSGACTWEGLKITTPATAANITANGIQVLAGGVPGSDMISVSNVNQSETANTINAFQTTWWAAPTGTNTTSANRIDLFNKNVGSGGTAGGLRIVTTGPGGAIASNTKGIIIDALISPSSAGTENGIDIGSGWDNGIAIATGTVGGGLAITANGVPTADMASISTNGNGVITAGVNALQITYDGGAANVESGALRINLNPGGTSGAIWNATRIVANATGPATGVTETGVKIEGPSTTGGAGTFNGINIINLFPATNGTANGIQLSSSALTQSAANTAAVNGLLLSTVGALNTNTTAGIINWNGVNLTTPTSTVNFAGSTINTNALSLTTGNITQTAGTVKGTGVNITLGTITTGGTQQGINITPSNSNATGNEYAVNVGNITAGAATETALNIGSGWDNALVVSGTPILNSTGVLQNGGLSGTYSNGLTLSGTVAISGAASTYVGSTLALTPASNVAGITVTGTNVTSANLLNLSAKNTSGTLFNQSYPSGTTLAGAISGHVIDLSTNVTATNQSETGLKILLAGATNTTGTVTNQGLAITGNAVVQNGAASVTQEALINLTLPALTQTSGQAIATGSAVTLNTITTNGIQTGYSVIPPGTAPAVGTTYGLNIGGFLSTGAGTSNEINLGSNWTNYLSAPNWTVTNGGAMTLGKASTTTGGLTFTDASNAFTSTFQQSTSATATVTYTLPVSAGTSGFVLSTDGTGVLSWIANGSGGGCSTCIIEVPTADANNTIVPTTDVLGLLVKQSTVGSPTKNVFAVTDSGGTNFAIKVDQNRAITLGAGAGQALTLSGGTGSGTQAGGAVSITAGNGSGTSQNGGSITLTAGNASSSNGAAGTITIKAGAGTLNTGGGSVSIDAGNDTGGNGNSLLNLGLTSSETINIGNTTATNPTSLIATGSTVNILSGFQSINLGSNVGNGTINIQPNAGGQAALIINKQGPNGDIFTASQSGTPKFKVDNSGNVRTIASLCVKAAAMSVNCAGTVAGTIYATTTTITAADYAENYISSQQLAPGDIVATAQDGNNQAIVRSTAAYQSTVMGIVSTDPGITLNSDVAADVNHPYVLPIALSGRVPLHVSTENGVIAAGDYLTSSSTPGVAMRSSKAGQVIAKALESYAGNGVGKIMVFVTITYADPTVIAGNQNMQLSGSAGTDIFATASSMVTLQSLSVDGLATISADLRVKGNGLFEGMLHVIDTLTTSNLIVTKVADFFGQVIFHTDVTFAGRPTFNKDTAGYAVIRKDADRVAVIFSKEYKGTPIVNATITLLQKENADGSTVNQTDLEQSLLHAGYSYIVTNTTTQGFTILLNKKAATDITFSWTALAVDTASTFEGIIPAAIASNSATGILPASNATHSAITSIFPLVTPKQ